MKLSWILFVASRYFRTRRREKGFASSVLAVAGISIGAATLITVLAVMNGFQMGFIEDILEISSYHLRIEETGDTRLSAQAAEAVRNVPGVTAVLPFKEVKTMIKGSGIEPHAVQLRGLPPDADELDPGLLRYLNVIVGGFDLHAPHSVVIGKELAYTLGVDVGDQVFLLALGGSGGSVQGVLRSEDVTFTVTGIFMSGHYPFDLSLGIISERDAGIFLPPDADRIWGVKIADRYGDARALASVKQILGPDAGGLRVISWREYNKSFFGALRMEKIMMMVLVGLIFIVVGVNIFYALKRSVYEKTEEIGVMRAIGAGPRSIQAIFVFEGVLIGLFGGLIGTAAGLYVSSHVNETISLVVSIVNGSIAIVGNLLAPIIGNTRVHEFSIFSPMYFYITEIPSRVVFLEVFSVFIFSLVSATGAAYFSAAKVSRIVPADVLRYE